MDWNDLFPGKTPEQVDAELKVEAQKLTEATHKVEEWKTHSRTWEDRSKENHTKLQKAEADFAQAQANAGEGGLSADEAAQLKQRVAKAEGELGLTQKLSLMGAPVGQLLDSKSFMDQVQGLDPEAEDYDESFTTLVESRTQGAGGPFVPNYAPGVRRQVSGGDTPKPSLWDEIHGDKKTTNTL